jgi:hypothetical protein
MKKLFLILLFLFITGPAWAQTQCLVPASNPATPVFSTVVSPAIIIKGSPGCVISGYAVAAQAAAGYLMAFNSKTVPADGAVTPQECIPVAAGSYNFFNFAPQPPEWYSKGVAFAYSSTGCLTKTTSDSVWFHALVQ